MEEGAPAEMDGAMEPAMEAAMEPAMEAAMEGEMPPPEMEGQLQMEG